MKRILVTGCGGAASVGVIRSLRKSNEDFFLVGTDSNIFNMPFSETNVNYLIPRASDKNYIEILNKIIDKEKIEWLHAQPDVEVLAISKNRHNLNANIFFPRHKTIEICQDKFLSWDAWKSHSLVVPESVLIKSEKDLDKAFELLKPPFWLRATSGYGGRGSIIAKDKKSAEAWLNYWGGWGNFIASELLLGRLFKWQSIWHDGELVCAQGRETLSWSLSHASVSGVTGMTGIVKTTNRKDLDEIAEKAVLSIDKEPNGVFGVDLKENAKGVPCPTEINAGRFLTTVHFFTEAGVNMPYIYVKLAYKEKIPRIKKYNPLPSELYWIRSVDSLPKLLKKEDFFRMCKNKVNFNLDKPDSSVVYNV